MVYGSVKAMKMGMNPELPSVDPHFSDTPKFNNK
jgi:hypothetical protein